MSSVCESAGLDAAWQQLRKASAILEVIYIPMNEACEQAALGTTIEMANDLIADAMETVRKFSARV